MQVVRLYRFNPKGTAWLPILRTHRGGRRYTRSFPVSFRAQAHELDMTHDWVVIYGMGSANREGNRTVITSRRGPLKVTASRPRLREAEYAQQYYGDWLRRAAENHG